MKKLLLFICAAAPLAVFAQSGKPFTVNGKLTNVSNAKKVYLLYRKDGETITDSSDVKNNEYSFKGALNFPTMGTLRLVYENVNGVPVRTVSQRDMYSLYLEPSKINISSIDSLPNAKITGSASDAQYRELQSMLKPYNDKGKLLNADYMAASKAKDQAKVQEIIKQFNELDSLSKENAYMPFIRKNPGSPVSLFAIQQVSGSYVNPDKVEPVFNSLSENVRNSFAGQAYKKRIDAARATEVGKLAMNFTQNDTLGNAVSLASFRGKYVLVDFWASWCGPCRQENPNVVKAYNKYKDKNFTILGVSLDDNDKESWINAIHKDGLAWTHVSDLKYWNNAVVQQYGINAIPANFLIDPSGKIIGKNLRGEELDKKLASVLGM
ncbi:MAG: thiol:disulfide interchange protein [Chitinophagaceae bacterium]|nr:thiol:disulfide interchange protein [Chitinophagaceae bacterium]